MLRNKLKTKEKRVEWREKKPRSQYVKWVFVKRIELEKNIYLGVFNREKVLVAVFKKINNKR